MADGSFHFVLRTRIPVPLFASRTANRQRFLSIKALIFDNSFANQSDSDLLIVSRIAPKPGLFPPKRAILRLLRRKFGQFAPPLKIGLSVS